MSIAARYLFIATIYGICAMLMGMVMGAKEDFTLMPAHAHLNLAGWIALTIYGIVYKISPEMGKSKLASVQFYTANLGILCMIPSLAIFLLGNRNVLPIMIVGELLTLTTLILFSTNIWMHRQKL